MEKTGVVMVTIGLLLVAVATILFFVAVSISTDEGKDEFEREQEEVSKEVMEMMMGEATSFFEALPLEKDLDLLRNVLYSGVWQKYDLKHKNAGKERV